LGSPLTVPFFDGYRRLLNQLAQIVGMMQQAVPERMNRWVNVVDEDLTDCARQQELASDACAAGKWLAVDALQKVIGPHDV